MKRAVLWDLDGTIADTAVAHFAAWQETMAAEGVAYSYERFLTDFGRNNGELLPELLGVDCEPERIASISWRKEAAFRQQLHGGTPVTVLPGVLDWLKHFEEAGMKQAIGSSGTMANIVAVVEHLGIGDYFHALLTGIRLPQGKPHPAVFLNLAQAIEMAPEDCVVIEDSVHGIEAARRAGMVSVAVGDVIMSPVLDEILETNPGPECLRLDRLSDLTWSQIDALQEG